LENLSFSTKSLIYSTLFNYIGIDTLHTVIAERNVHRVCCFFFSALKIKIVNDDDAVGREKRWKKSRTEKVVRGII
jgi:hypothetical protein